jgi:hypothetical protein
MQNSAKGSGNCPIFLHLIQATISSLNAGQCLHRGTANTPRRFFNSSTSHYNDTLPSTAHWRAEPLGQREDLRQAGEQKVHALRLHTLAAQADVFWIGHRQRQQFLFFWESGLVGGDHGQSAAQ